MSDPKTTKQQQNPRVNMDADPLEKEISELKISASTIIREYSYSRSPPSRTGELEDVMEEDGRLGPVPIRIRAGRSPRRREDEQYMYSLSGIPRIGNRRCSDPGRISVSPLRSRVKLECDISEDGDESHAKREYSNRLHTHRSNSLDPTEIDEAYFFGRSRSRSPHTQSRLKPQRSNSLPGIEFEIGEAIGALAVKQVSLSPEPIRTGLGLTTPGSSGTPRRRRSVSVETTPLEAILENPENPGIAKCSRRFSTPAVNTATVVL